MKPDPRFYRPERRPRPGGALSFPPPGRQGTYLPRRFGGRWYFALRRVLGGKESWLPVGYCGDKACEGHESAEGARGHYREWLLAEGLRLSVPVHGETRLCEICEVFAPFRARVVWWLWQRGLWQVGRRWVTTRAATCGRWYSWALCLEHQKREWVAKLLPDGIERVTG